MKRIRNSESGNILLLTAILLPVLLGMGALALDAGYYFDRRQRIGAAADAAALAGANEVKLNSAITATALESAVRADSALNGFTHGVNNVTVLVNCPPSEGPKAGGTCADGFVEVKVRQTVPGFLMRILGRNSMDVEDRAVAGPTDDTGCIYALASGASSPYNYEINVLASASVNVPNCRVISNDEVNIAASGSITAKAVEVSATTCGTCTGRVTGPVRTNVARSADPFGAVNFANKFTGNIGVCNNTNFVGPGGGTTLNPGVYCGNATNPAIKLTSNSNYTFNPGVYYLVGGGLSVSQTASVTGTGVSFYFTANGVTYPYVGCNAKVIDFQASPGGGGGGGGEEGGGGGGATPTINLSAPTSGATEAMLFVQDRNEPTCASGSTVVADIRHQTLALDGVMYFPKEHVIYGASGGSGSSTGVYWDLITHTVEFTGLSHTDHNGHDHYEHDSPHSHSGHEE